MKRNLHLSLLLFLFLVTPLLCQNIEGKWYDIAEHDFSLEMDFKKNNGKTSGLFSGRYLDEVNTIDAPLEKIEIKNDSLSFSLNLSGFMVRFKLKHDASKNTYDGFTYFGSQQIMPVVLSRTAIVKDSKVSKVEEPVFTRQDTLRGTITPEREWWDLTYYDLAVRIQPDQKYISGKNTIQYKVLKPNSVLQIDLQSPLELTRAVQNGKELTIKHDGNAHFITLTDKQEVGKVNSIDVYFKGNPKEAENAPWDGGFSWDKDKNGNHFVATSCQGLGASVWWPNKDHMYDEPDSMMINVTIPKGLTNISNGRLRSLKENADDTVTSQWFVQNPINNYGVNVNIGDYVHFSEVYPGEKGPLDMDYYVLRDNLEKAKKQFKDAPKMMKAFEHWFGPYPFYEDGFKLVEVPYLGMEHQSSVTYGNQYENGYLGRDLSNSGWGLKFDFIIIHESGHEWFANNITYRDIADMWIHESFTNYSENLFVDYYYGKKASSEYVIGTRWDIKNKKPIIGQYNVNNEGSGDMYPKGGNMLHTLRQLVDDDEKWRQILRGLNKEFYHKTVTTKQIESYIAKEAGMDLQAFFDQYLRTVEVPTLEYYMEGKKIFYKWINAVPGFDMPLKVKVDGKEIWIHPNKDWTRHNFDFEPTKLSVDPNFYVSEFNSIGR